MAGIVSGFLVVGLLAMGLVVNAAGRDVTGVLG
jgi:hypothetical protein